MASLGLLCVAASSAAAATTTTCTVSWQRADGTTAPLLEGDDVILRVDVAGGMPAGGTATFWTPYGDIQQYLDPIVDASGYAIDWYAGAGTYDVRADVYDALGHRVCTSTNDVVLFVSRPADLVTTTAVTLDPASPAPGDLTNVTATVTVPPATGFTVSGTVVFYGDSARFGSAQVTAVNDTTGTATFQFAVPTSEGSHVISAWYLGDEHFAPSSGTASLGVNKATPTIVAVGGSPVHYNGQTSVSGKLLDGASQPIVGRTVDFTLSSGEHCSATTGADGVGTCASPITMSHPAGTYTVSAAFAGDSAYSAATGSGSVVVTPAQTSLLYGGPASAVPNQPATLSATLKDEYGNALAGRQVQLAFAAPGSDSCDATTDVNGVGSCAVTSISEAPGTYAVTATYAGAAGFYAGTSTTGTVVVANGIPTRLTFQPNSVASIPGLPTRVAFTLTDAAGPVAYAPVTITFNGTAYPTTTTSSSGVATIFPLAPPIGGTYPASAVFAADGVHLGSTGAGTITVAPAPTFIKLTGTPVILNGTKATLSATLKLWNGTPLGGKPVTLSAGNASCPATTNSAGLATCQTTTAVTGGSRAITVTAAFAGETGTLLPATDSGAGYVYVFGSGGGVFVRGDRDVDDQVSFWGSQWSKWNPLSHGSAPDAFKGFAATVTTPGRCNTTWTTRPGNSTPPPSGPLPPYMAVVVSSSIQKSGSAISGDVVKIVVVKTDSGYDSNPGHAGTGTVIATVCG